MKPVVLLPVKAQPLAESTLSRPIRLCKLLINDGNQRRALFVSRSKRSPLNDWRLHNLKIVLVDYVAENPRRRLTFWKLMPFRRDVLNVLPRRQGHSRGQRDVANPRQCARLLDKVAVEIVSLLVRVAH